MKWCGNCKYYEDKKETESYTIYGYCNLYECDLCENEELNTFEGCEAFTIKEEE